MRDLDTKLTGRWLRVHVRPHLVEEVSGIRTPGAVPCSLPCVRWEVRTTATTAWRHEGALSRRNPSGNGAGLTAGSIGLWSRTAMWPPEARRWRASRRGMAAP